MRFRLVSLLVGLMVLAPLPAAAAGQLPSSSALGFGDDLQQFESIWTNGGRIYDRFLLAVAPSDVEVAPLPADSGEGRRIVYSISEQSVWLVDDSGVILANYLVSGALSRPGPGSYKVFSKSPWTTSFLSRDITMRWMVRFAKTDKTNIGFHDLPRKNGKPMQTLDQLGTALSGGCIRQEHYAAVRLYRWADLGTPVIVTP